MDGNTLTNKANLWTSDDEWNIRTRDKFVHIENISKNKVLGISHDGSIAEEDFVENEPGQLWKRGKPNADGYFILEHSDTPKVMTGISPSRLEVKGKCKLSELSKCIVFDNTTSFTQRL